MSACADPSKGRPRVLSSPLWGHNRTYSGPAPVGLLALGALASPAGIQTRGSTIGGGDLVRSTGTREQFVTSGLIDQVCFPMRQLKFGPRKG
jgi:hypothetical protein